MAHSPGIEFLRTYLEQPKGERQTSFTTHEVELLIAGSVEHGYDSGWEEAVHAAEQDQINLEAALEAVTA